MADAEEPRAGHLRLLLPDPPVHARVLPGGGPITLDELLIAGPAGPWRALGLEGDQVGRVRLRFGAEGDGIVAWRLRGADDGSIDGLRTLGSDAPERAPAPGPFLAVDHVVASTPDFDRTRGALAAAGFEERRVREAGVGPDAVLQAFYVVGDALLELVGPRAPAGDGPAAFWGLVLVVEDVDAAAERLGDLAGRPRDAVQPGRRIVTIRRHAGLGTQVALMTPRSD